MVVCSFSSGHAAEIEVSSNLLVLLCKCSTQEQGIMVGLFRWFYVHVQCLYRVDSTRYRQQAGMFLCT